MNLSMEDRLFESKSCGLKVIFKLTKIKIHKIFIYKFSPHAST